MLRLHSRPLIVALVTATVILTYCKGASTNAAPRDESHREWNDIARFLAGMDPEPGSTIAEFESMPEAKSQQQYFAKIWPEVEKNQLVPQREWRNKELGKQEGFIFYPFSGADFLNIYTFFPEGQEYLFFGLEPTGPAPALKDLAKKEVGPSLAALQVSLRSILNYSFFQTLHMINDLKAAKLSGVAPVLLVFAARTGNTVHSVRNIRVHADGTLEQLADPYGTQQPAVDPRTDFVPGIRVVFQKPGSKEFTNMDYFSVDISDAGIAQKPYFLKYIRSRGVPATYLKAASYLMYNKEFNGVRNFILDESRIILQDDSGIPLQYFSKDKFDLTFYGAYTTPIPLFTARYQADLRAAYTGANKPKDLPFGIGYQFRKGASNLMLAKKKQSP
ncbi:MAG: hypothetical protein K8S54_11230 [Spirochaetia bacterium]|nr:hypothetical protein [Spirochaetia bacterium]